MRTRLKQATVIAALLTVALATACVVYVLPRVKLAYWEWRSTSLGPNQHGKTVQRYVRTDTPYQRWLENAKQRIPVFEGLVIQDVATVALHPWPEMGEGVVGLYLRFSDYQLSDGRILEMPAGRSTRPQRHLFEAAIYVLKGQGHTELHRDGNEPLRVDWREGSLLSIPLNVQYRLVNDGAGPVRVLAVTSFPFVINSMASESFVFENSFEFSDRFDGSDTYFGTVKPLGERLTATNLVPDVGAAALRRNEKRSAGVTQMQWAMAGNTHLDMHSTEIPPQSYKKAHRHSSDAFILFLSGKGYSLIWRGEDIKNRQRIDWQKGTLFVPPTYWYHQHLNVSAEPARHLAINVPILVENLGLRFGDQLDTDLPEVRREWEEALALEHRHDARP